MKQLISLTANEIGNDLVETVNARELHAFLGVSTRFNDWIFSRVRDFGFVEDADFVTFTENSVKGRPTREYALTLDMAKEIAMVERNEKGRQARRYFIECEKRLRSGVLPKTDARESRLQMNLSMRIGKAIGLNENQRILAANKVVKRLTGVDYLGTMDAIALRAPTNEADLTPSQIGQRLDGISAQKVNSMLLEYGYQDAHRDHKGRIYYEPTEKGYDCGAVFKDTAKRSGQGTPVKQLFWSTSVIDALRTAMLADVE